MAKELDTPQLAAGSVHSALSEMFGLEFPSWEGQGWVSPNLARLFQGIYAIVYGLQLTVGESIQAGF